MSSKRKIKTTALPKSKRQKQIDAYNKANSEEGKRDAEYLAMLLSYKGKWPKGRQNK